MTSQQSAFYANDSNHRAHGLAGLAALALVAGLASCNTFDPNLGSAPFRCGLDNPRCPNGYECVTYSAAEEICEIKGGTASRADGGSGGGSFTCNDDGVFEPNNSISQPTFTSIPASQPMIKYVGLAICPDTDQDYYQFKVETNGTNVTAEIEYQSGRGQLSLNVLNSSGTSIGSGSPVAGNMNLLRATIPNLAIGDYFVQVLGAAPGVQNNYSVQIVTQ